MAAANFGGSSKPPNTVAVQAYGASFFKKKLVDQRFEYVRPTKTPAVEKGAAEKLTFDLPAEQAPFQYLINKTYLEIQVKLTDKDGNKLPPDLDHVAALGILPPRLEARLQAFERWEQRVRAEEEAAAAAAAQRAAAAQEQQPVPGGSGMQRSQSTSALNQNPDPEPRTLHFRTCTHTLARARLGPTVA